MIILFFLAIAVLSAYLACTRPPWFWAIYICCLSLFCLLGTFVEVDYSRIPLGPILLRATDAATFGLAVGILYHGGRCGFRFLKGKPAAMVVGAIFFFLAAKIIFSVTLGSSQIASNRSVSHVAGGLVAAAGDLRDNLLALITPLYAYATARYCKLRMLGWPIVVSTCLILFRGMVHVAVMGQIWTDSAQDRFISSHEAVTLTILSFLLLFLKAPGLSRIYTRALAFVAFTVALVANHRSQWVAALGGASVLILITLLAKPLFSNAKLARLALTSAALLLFAVGAFVAVGGDGLFQRFRIFDVLTVRLYAITDPTRDADANWRKTIWKDRIDQVGDDWPWGRELGDRHESLFHGEWITVPDHSAYVSVYELGGLILSALVACFWGTTIWVSCVKLFRNNNPEALWPPATALAVIAASLAFGMGYDFPIVGPAFAVLLIME
jgi:hypothetical protein